MHFELCGCFGLTYLYGVGVGQVQRRDIQAICIILRQMLQVCCLCGIPGSGDHDRSWRA